MRLERLTGNKIKIIISSDDLFERGLTKEDIWKESKKWHQLFYDMLDEASEEFDVNINGAVAVEIFSFQSQGMIMIITVENGAEDEEILYDGFIEMQVRVKDSEILLYQFDTIDDMIELSTRLSIMNIYGGSVYVLNHQYYLMIENLDPSNLEQAASILSEYGSPSIISPYVLSEYGKNIIKNKAVETLLYYFK